MADQITDPATGCTIREMAGRGGRDMNQGDTAERKFLIKESADPLVAYEALWNQKDAIALEIYSGLPVTVISWQLLDGPDQWEFTCTYTQLPEPGGYTVSMDSSGGTGKQTEAYQQVRYDAPQTTVPADYGTSINVQDGKPQGVERVLPALKLEIVARIQMSLVASPIAYAKTVASVTGTVNSAPYLGFASGELLFMGGSGQIIGENPVLTYTFAASPNLTNQTIGPISGINKNGHDYIWFKYAGKLVSNRTVQQAESAYVAKVYTYSDFSVLNIGV